MADRALLPVHAGRAPARSAGEIHHPPWKLRAAEAEINRNTMASQIGIPLTGQPLLHFAGRQDVVFWALRPAEGQA